MPPLPRQIVLLRCTLQSGRLTPLLHIHPFSPTLHITRLITCLLFDLLLRSGMQIFLDLISVDFAADGLGFAGQLPAAGIDVGVPLGLGYGGGEFALGT